MLMLGRKPVSPLCMPYAGIEKATNCVLEIPQNIKLTIENNVLTVKNGSVLVMSGSSTYRTITVNADRTKDFSSYQDGKIVVFANTIGGLGLDGLLNRVGSGSSLPADNTTYSFFYLTTDYSIYHYEGSSWVKKDASYPLCVLEKDSSGVHFAKDSNGNDMIFNGAGFIGHHAFVYPGVKALIPNGFNSDDSYRNIEINRNTLYIRELPLGTQEVFIINNNSVWTAQYKGEVNDINDIPNVNGIYYVKNLNKNIQMYNNEKTEYTGTPFISYTYDNIVTDFTIRQPLTKYRWVVKLIP